MLVAVAYDDDDVGRRASETLQGYTNLFLSTRRPYDVDVDDDDGRGAILQK